MPSNAPTAHRHASDVMEVASLGPAGDGTRRLGRRELASPWGTLLAVSADDALHGLYFADQEDFPSALAKQLQPGSTAVLEQLADEWQAYLGGRLNRFSVPLVRRGTPFQQRVWQALMDCPFGQTVSYGTLAQRAGSPGGARAVGQAVGRNPWIVVVPCHRVLAAAGRLGGFSAGVARKQLLLRHEGIAWR